MMSSDSIREEKRIADAIKNTVTSQDVAVVARRAANHSDVQVLEHSVEPYSPDKLGFLGSHRLLKIKIKRKFEGDAKTINLFVKSIPYECERQASFLSDSGFFAEEYNFFNAIVPLLLENYEGEKWAPTCYLAKSDSLIMEDLRCQDYKLRSSLFDGYGELKSVLAALARFHGCSILAEAQLNRFSKELLTLQKKYPNFVEEKTFKREGKVYTWFTSATNVIYTICEQSGRDICELRKGFDQIFKVVRPSKVHRNVICHGDLWTNNIMLDDSKPSPKCVLVDFQIIRYAPQVLDILMLLYLHTSREFRNAHEKELIEFYYSVLEKTIRKSDLAKEAMSPTLQDILAALKDLRIFGPAIACLWFPMVLMDPEIIKEKTKDSDGFDDFIFGDRTDVTMAYYNKNEPYRNKIDEVINELAIISDKL